ncbi:MAG: hypothetical protein AAF192_01095 [Pseudomonadota bacterium]
MSTNREIVTQAMTAATVILIDCRRIRTATTVTVQDIVLFGNSLQSNFEIAARAETLPDEDIAAVLAGDYGSRAPDNARVTLGEAQAAGQAVIGSILTEVYTAAVDPAYDFDPVVGRHVPTVVTPERRAALAPHVAALEAVLDPLPLGV